MKKGVALCMLIVFAICTSTAQDWQTDYNRAKELASSTNKTIVLVFQGSDWCAPCIKLDREIWSTDTFKTYSEKHYVMLQADFPRKKSNALSAEQTKANAALAEKYNPKGYFPFVVVLNAKGDILGQTSYKKTTPQNFITELNAFVN